MKHPIIITSGGSVEHRSKYECYRIISNLLSSRSAQQSLAQSMIAPLRKRLDYQGIARKVFLVDQLPDPSKDFLEIEAIVKGYKYDAIRISSRGRLYRKGQLSGASRRVTIPSFNVCASPTIHLSSIKSRRFDIIDRNVQKARQETMSQEDSMIFETLDKLGKNG